MKWIKCSERLPTSKEKVAFTYDGHEIHTYWVYYDPNNEKFYQEYTGGYTGEVGRPITHWMLFPEIPKEV